MKKAMREATAKAARMGTKRIAGVPNRPPNRSDRTVVGSKVAAEDNSVDENIEENDDTDDDDDAADADENKSRFIDLAVEEMCCCGRPIV